MPDEPQRYVLGVGYMPGKNPAITKGMDGGRDFFTEAELEKASWTFLADGNPQVGVGHVDGTTEGTATVVESYIWRGPDWDLGDGTVITKGTWMIGAILSPKAWQAHLDGHLTGWSLQGTARRRRVRAELPGHDGILWAGRKRSRRVSMSSGITTRPISSTYMIAVSAILTVYSCLVSLCALPSGLRILLTGGGFIASASAANTAMRTMFLAASWSNSAFTWPSGSPVVVIFTSSQT